MTATVLLVALAAFTTILVLKGRGTLHEMLYPGLYRSADFPEDRFPAGDHAAFRAKVARGYACMKGASVVICGITKDDAETLPRTIRRIERTGASFREHRVVVFENDSTDGTPAILREWAGRNPNVRILSESLRGLPDFPKDRYGRLACCRNRYLDHLNGEYVIVVDMDLRGGWSLDGIASTFAETGWDAVASNSIGYHNLRRSYYDVAALRPRTVLKDGWSYRVFGEGWQLRRGDPMIPVESAFGGLCVYRREVFLSRRYAGASGGVPACEHLALNADGRLRFFLNPSQITVAGTQEAKGYEAKRPWRRHLHRLLRNW
jgi:glycosyltransferase involved in cell wall biosynthesis